MHSNAKQFQCTCRMGWARRRYSWLPPVAASLSPSFSWPSVGLTLR